VVRTPRLLCDAGTEGIEKYPAEKEVAAAGKTRPNFKSTMPVVTRKPRPRTKVRESERRRGRATTDASPSAMPLAKARANRHGRSFMALFATAQAFQYEKSAETDRTNASL